MPWRRRIVRTVVAEILIPSLRSSPRIRWYPQRGFSRPSRTTRSLTLGSIGGRPSCPFFRKVHFFRTSSRCQRSKVSGRTTNEDQLLLGIARLAAANRTRSRRLSRGRDTCRWSTFTWCRSTRSSMSFSSARRPPTPRRRWIRKYRSENSMELLPAEENACYRCRKTTNRGS